MRDMVWTPPGPWMFRKTRSVGVVVSMGELSAGPDAPPVEFVDEAGELTGSPPQPIEVEDDEDVAFAELVEAGVEVRALRGRSRGVILEDPLASGFVVRVELAVEHLAPFDRGDAALPDEAHGVCAFPKNPIGPQHIARRKFRGCRGRNRTEPPIWGSTKICGVKRRDRPRSERPGGVRARRLDVQPSMSATSDPTDFGTSRLMGSLDGLHAELR